MVPETTFRAEYDGHVLIPVDPIELRDGEVVTLRIESPPTDELEALFAALPKWEVPEGFIFDRGELHERDR